MSVRRQFIYDTQADIHRSNSTEIPCQFSGEECSSEAATAGSSNTAALQDVPGRGQSHPLSGGPRACARSGCCAVEAHPGDFQECVACGATFCPDVVCRSKAHTLQRPDAAAALIRLMAACQCSTPAARSRELREVVQSLGALLRPPCVCDSPAGIVETAKAATMAVTLLRTTSTPMPEALGSAIVAFWTCAAAMELPNTAADALAWQANVFGDEPHPFPPGCTCTATHAALAASLVHLGINRAGVSTPSRHRIIEALAHTAVHLDQSVHMRLSAQPWLRAAAAAVTDGGWIRLADVLASPISTWTSCSVVEELVMATDIARLGSIADCLVTPAVLRSLVHGIDVAHGGAELRETANALVTLSHVLLVIGAGRRWAGGAARRPGGGGGPGVSSTAAAAALPSGTGGAALSQAFQCLAASLGALQAFLEQRVAAYVEVGGSKEGGGAAEEALTVLQLVYAVLKDRTAWEAAAPGGVVSVVQQCLRPLTPAASAHIQEVGMLQRRMQRMPVAACVAPVARATLSAAEQEAEVDRLMAELDQTAQPGAGGRKKNKKKKKKSQAGKIGTSEQALHQEQEPASTKDQAGTDESEAVSSSSWIAPPLAGCASASTGQPLGAGLKEQCSGASAADSAPTQQVGGTTPCFAAPSLVPVPDGSSAIPASAMSPACQVASLQPEAVAGRTAAVVAPRLEAAAASAAPSSAGQVAGSTRSRAPSLEPPPGLVCPITMALLVDPVMTADGFMYSRAAIEGWLRKECTSPMTGQPLPAPVVLTPCHAVRGMVREWEQLHGQRGV